MGGYSRFVLPWVLEGMMRFPGIARHRRAALEGVEGDVLEIGFGSGVNLPHYPEGVRRVVGVEPAGEFSRLADKRLSRAKFPVEVVGLSGEQIAADTASFDTAVSTFTMCSITGLDAALAQVRRVVKPNGRFHFLEHGFGPKPRVQRMQKRLNRPWGAVMGGCRLDVKIDEVVTNAGFELESLEKFYLGWSPRFCSYFYRGVARRR
jgi:ubiquinone/menaquinone biosynthesis C-methylase UbiE